MGKKRMCVCLPDVRMSCCASVEWRKCPTEQKVLCFSAEGWRLAPSQSCWRTQFLSVRGDSERHPRGSPSSAIVHWLWARVRAREDTGVSAGTCLRVLLDPERNTGHNYITVVLPGWLTPFKSPLRSFSLPSASSEFFKSALWLRRGFCRSREDFCVGEVWVCWSKWCSEMM